MSDSRDSDKVDDLGISWGRKKGVGARGTKNKVQFYESFKYDGMEYFLYDSVYLFKEGEPEPYIGKLIKLWYNKSLKQNKAKVLWFFKPSEISNYLGDENVLKNELFLATGEGMGLTNINPLEAIAGKCNVICISKDERNRQPSHEELAKADYVFYRTFDVGKFIISDKLGDNIAATEVSSLLNKRYFQLPDVSVNNKESANVVAGLDNSLSSIKDTLGEEARQSDIDGGSLLVKDHEGTIDMKVKQKCDPIDKHGGDGLRDSAPVAVLVTGLSDCNETDLDKDIKSAARLSSSESRTLLNSKRSGAVNTVDDKANNFASKLSVDSSANACKSSTRSAVADGKGKPEVAMHIHGPSAASGKEKARNSLEALEERPSKKIKVDDNASLSSEKGRNDSHIVAAHTLDEKKRNYSSKMVADSGATSVKDSIPSTAAADRGKPESVKDVHGSTGDMGKLRTKNCSGALEERSLKKLKVDDTTTPSSDKGRNVTPKSAISVTSDKSLRHASAFTAETSGRGKLAEDGVGTNNGLLKKLKTEIVASGAAGAAAVSAESNGTGKLGERVIRTSNSITKKSGKKVISSDKLGKTSLNQPKNAEMEAYGHVKEVTPRPDTGKQRWFTMDFSEEHMKTASKQGTLVLFQNLDPSYTSSEVEDIVWHGFRESCTAKMIQRTAISSPHSGEAFVIFKTRMAAEKVVNKLDQGCLMLPNGRPLVGSYWVESFGEKQSSFPGHLVIDKLRLQLQREAKAVSTSHSAQPTTLEYEMAIEWRLLQERAELWWKKLYKQQGGELRKLKASLKSKRA